MSGSIRKRSKDSYQLRFEGPPDASGERRQLSETVRGTRKDAERVLRQRLSSIDSGGFIERDRQTVGSFLESWLSTVATSVSPRTLFGYEGPLRRYVLPKLGGVPLQALRPQAIQGLYSELLERPLSPSTVASLHRILHKALADGVRWELLARNPSDAVTPPRFERPEMILWTSDEIAKFFEAAEGSQFADAYRLLLMTGLRRSELGGLQWSSVDLERGSLQVTQTLQRLNGGLVVGQPKTAKSRRPVALSPDTVAVFRRMRARQLEHRLLMGAGWQDTGYVLTGIDGSPTDPHRLTKDFTRRVKRSGLPHLSLHGLRHQHASLLLMNGTHLKVVSERLGHSNISMTADVYSHILPGLQESAAASLDNLLTGMAG